MAAICQGCGREIEVPVGYARNKIQCPGCGVICPVPEGGGHPTAPVAKWVPAPSPFDPPPVAAVPVSPFDDAPIEAEIVPAPAQVVTPCRRCGKPVRGGRLCEACAAELDRPLSMEPEPPPAVMPSLELGETIPVRMDSEEDSPYELNEPIGEPCPKCHAEMPLRAVLCTRCGYNRQTKKKLARSFTPVHREWESDMPLSSRIAWLVAGQAFHLVMGLLVFSLFGTWLPALIMWAPLTAMLCFLLGTYDRIVLTRDEKGRVRITKQWRVAFVPREPTVIEVRGYEGVVSGPWLSVGFLEWFVFLTLLPWGIVPGLVWYYYAMHLPHYHAALAQDHGQVSVYIYRGRSGEQMNEIADAVCDAAGIRRL